MSFRALSDDRLVSFTDMTHEIDAIKLDAATARTDQLLRDLAQIKDTRPDKYQLLRSALAVVLESGKDPVRPGGQEAGGRCSFA